MLASLLAVLSAGSKYSLETDPNAVCVDGSPAAYYYEPASTEASALTWIIYLQGGGMCYSESGCYSRCTNKPTRCSSTSWGDDEKGGLGILLADDPVLRHAHKVYLRYCTSDAHWGNVQQAEWTWNGVPMQFRGRRVVEAMLADLVATHGLGASPGTTLIWSGTSAGARGAMAHLDVVPHVLGAAATNVRLVGVLDSPLWLDLEACDDCSLIDPASKDSLPQVVRFAHERFNVSQGLLGERCVAAFPNATEQWRCLLGEYRLPLLDTSFMVLAALHDTFVLNNGMGTNDPTEPGEIAYAAEVTARTLASVEGLAAAAAEPGGVQVGVFSHSCTKHGQAYTWSGWDGVHVNDEPTHTPGEVLVRLLAGEAVRYVDECSGFLCGSGCDPDRVPPRPPSPSAPLPPASPCTECADEPTPWIASQGGSCADSVRDTPDACTKSWWESYRYCAASCHHAGYPYSDSFCCPLPPSAPPPVLSPPPSPPLPPSPPSPLVYQEFGRAFVQEFVHTHQVILSTASFDTAPLCAGSLLSPYWVLTAAHCFDAFGTDATYWAHIFRWEAGTDPTTDVPCEEAVRVEQVILEPWYDPESREDDLALLRLAWDAPCVDGGSAHDLVTLYEQPGGLDDWTLSNRLASEVGWAAAAQTGYVPGAHREEVEVSILAPSSCKTSLEGDGHSYTSGLVCASPSAADACPGTNNGGAPLLLHEGGVVYQVGIVSWSTGCAGTGVYTYLSKYSDWLEKVAIDSAALVVNGDRQLTVLVPSAVAACLLSCFILCCLCRHHSLVADKLHGMYHHIHLGHKKSEHIHTALETMNNGEFHVVLKGSDAFEEADDEDSGPIDPFGPPTVYIQEEGPESSEAKPPPRSRGSIKNSNRTALGQLGKKESSLTFKRATVLPAFDLTVGAPDTAKPLLGDSGGPAAARDRKESVFAGEGRRRKTLRAEAGVMAQVEELISAYDVSVEAEGVEANKESWLQLRSKFVQIKEQHSAELVTLDQDRMRLVPLLSGVPRSMRVSSKKGLLGGALSGSVGRLRAPSMKGGLRKLSLTVEKQTSTPGTIV